MLHQKKISRFSTLALFFVLWITIFNSSAAATAGYYYQIKIYHFKDAVQQQAVDNYLKDYYLPRLHKMGMKNIGVFKPIETDTMGKRTYVFIPFKSWKDMEVFNDKVSDNSSEAVTGNAYIDAVYNNASYTRTETIVLKAFATRLSPAAPNLTAKRADRIYELRSYESPTEKYHYNKVRMFNSGETDLFDRIGSNPVFYGSVIAGSHMPNLMYMTAYSNMPDRDKHWEVFVNSPEWKALVAKDEFKNSVSRNDIVFLHPTEYSDF